MEIWRTNFIWIAVLLAVLCWFVTKFLWFEKLHFFLRLPIVLVGTVCVMTVLGAVAALMIHAGVFPNIFQSILKDPVGGLVFLAETGGETVVLWFPVMLIRTLLLIIKPFKKK